MEESWDDRFDQGVRQEADKEGEPNTSYPFHGLLHVPHPKCTSRPRDGNDQTEEDGASRTATWDRQDFTQNMFEALEDNHDDNYVSVRPRLQNARDGRGELDGNIHCARVAYMNTRATK